MISSLLLKNYRNLNLDIQLQKDNIVVAQNGTGKSNLLEAIYISTMGRSFRPVSEMAEFLGPEQPFAKVEISHNADKLEMLMSGETVIKRKYLWNNKAIGLSKLIGKIPVILFAPHHVSLVADDPHSRRNDLDDFLSILYPTYSETLARFIKVLKNRNALLKNLQNYPSHSGELTFWTDEFVRLATELHDQRQKFIEAIGPFIAATAAEVYRAGSPEFGVEFMPNSFESGNYAEVLAQKFAANYQKEIVVGSTLYGPQKDDYAIVYAGKNLRYLGSRGEQRIAVFIWKLAQYKYHHSLTGQSATLLIDDLMSELDNQHRQAIAKLLVNGEFQYVLAAAESSDVPKQLLTQANQLKIS